MVSKSPEEPSQGSGDSPISSPTSPHFSNIIPLLFLVLQPCWLALQIPNIQCTSLKQGFGPSVTSAIPPPPPLPCKWILC